MIVLASVNDPHSRIGRVYSTTIGNTGEMCKFEKLEFLAPTWNMVWGVKGKGRGWAELTQAEREEKYTTEYRYLIKGRWDDVSAWLEALDPNEDITLLCYCSRGKFCHRRLLDQMIRRHRPDIEVVLK